MNELKRMLELSGHNPKQQDIEQVEAERTRINAEYEAAIEALRQGKQLDEGLFTSLKAALQTAANLGQQGTKKIVDTTKKVAANVKELYLDKKAQEELKILVTELTKLIAAFDSLSTKVPTIIKRDVEVKKEMDLFKKVFEAVIRSLYARMAVKEGLTTADEIDKMIRELLEEVPSDNKTD